MGEGEGTLVRLPQRFLQAHTANVGSNQNGRSEGYDGQKLALVPSMNSTQTCSNAGYPLL